MLSYDGTKIFTAGNGRYRNNRYDPRGKGGRNRGNNQQKDNKDGKPNRGKGNKQNSKAGSSVSFLEIYVGAPTSKNLLASLDFCPKAMTFLI